jgi:hypothetical protein
MGKLILMVALTVINMQALGTLPPPTGESVKPKRMAPIMIGQPRRSQPAYRWDRRDSPTVPVRRPPLAPR